jgi:acyl carrier protein
VGDLRVMPDAGPCPRAWIAAAEPTAVTMPAWPRRKGGLRTPIVTFVAPSAPFIRPPDEESPVTLDSSAAQRSPIGEVVAGYWTQALGVPSVRSDEDFFELGGDSLMAIEILGALSARLKIPLSFRHLMDHPVFGEFIAVVEHAVLENVVRGAVSADGSD